MFNDLERIFNLLDWDTKSYKYCRPTLDSSPYQIIKDDKNRKSTIVFNAVGIDEKDIKVEVNRKNGRDVLTFSGETKNEVIGKNYNVDSEFFIRQDEIKGIEWHCENGLLYIVIEFKQPETPKFEIKRKHK